MFNIGFPEILLILVVALLVFGPSKLPSVGKSLGQALREFKKAGEELTRSVTEEHEGAPASPTEPLAVSPVEPPAEMKKP